MEQHGCRGQLIVAMKGHPGTGKTTLARSIAAALRCPLLDKDDVRDATLPLELHHNIASILLNDLSYAVLWRLADSQIRLGLPYLVVDSPLSRRAHLDRLLHVAARASPPARLVVVECRPSDAAEWRSRLEKRAIDGGDGASWHKPSTWQDLRRLVEGYGGCDDYEMPAGVERIVVDTMAAGDAAAAAAAATAVEFIKSVCCGGD